MKIWKVAWLQEEQEELDRLIDTVSSGEGALTEEQVAEMLVRRLFAHHYKMPRDVPQELWEEAAAITVRSLTREGRRVVKEGMDTLINVLDQLDKEESQTGEKKVES